ncbi:MAG: PorV/PorQ family protein [Elusimicrobia bacterium]|nr:PorV/PorQ family protein [Elusimicrobiota bacterium]
MSSIRRTLKLLALCVPAALAPAAPAAAAYAAGNAFDFLRLDAGAAGMALGGAVAGRPLDAYGVFYNPALNYASGREGFLAAGLSYSSWEQGINYQDAVAGLRSGKSAYGMGYRRLDYGNISAVNSAGVRLYDYTAGAYIFSLDYSHELEHGLVVGAAAKTAAETIDGAVSRVLLFDFGLYFRPSEPELEKFTVGLALKNAGGSLRADSGKEKLPRMMEVATAYKPFAAKELSIMLGLAVPGAPHSMKNELRAGVEYSPLKGFFLRAGYSSGRDTGCGFRAGAGVVFRGLSVDYALLPAGGFGVTHHLGINLKFNTAGAGRKAARTEPAAAPVPAAVPVPAIVPVPAAEPAPVVVPEPVLEPSPGVEPTLVIEPTPEFAPTLVIDSTSAVQHRPLVEPVERPRAPR